MFQSAPPVETRGDLPVRRLLFRRSCFNPLPPSKRGEIDDPAYTDRPSQVSIRSPRRNEGRSGKLPHDTVLLIVSIRSPRRNEGRYILGGIDPLSLMFQSAPPVETRGDTGSNIAYRSITGFNPLPPSKRGEIGTLCECSSTTVFNPLPPSKRGEMQSMPSILKGAVSRSPRRNEGRCLDREDTRGCFNPLPPSKRGEI